MTDESIAVWQEKVQPILSALREHITIDQIEKLYDEAQRDAETPPSIRDVIKAFYYLCPEAEHL